MGIDRRTGGIITGWAHVVQSIDDFFTTQFGERVLREWYGSMVPNLLGRNMVPKEILPFFAAIASAIDTWEPRVRVTRVMPIDKEPEVFRSGEFHFYMEVAYMPRALYGDFTVEGFRRVSGRASDGGINIAQLAV